MQTASSGVGGGRLKAPHTLWVVLATFIVIRAAEVTARLIRLHTNTTTTQHAITQ